jgi:hypothetical protein
MKLYGFALILILASSNPSSYCNSFKFTLGDHEFEANLQKNATASTNAIIQSIRKELAAYLHLSENYFKPEVVDFEIFAFNKGIFIDDQNSIVRIEALLSIDEEIENEGKEQRLGLAINNKKLNTIVTGLILLKDAFLEEWFRFSQQALLPEWIQLAQTRFDETAYFTRNIEDGADKFCSMLNNRCNIKLNVLFIREKH